MELIGLNGRLRSGKDTAFDIVQKANPQLKVARAAFADKLKLSAAIALGFTPESAEDAVAICNRIKDAGTVTTAWHNDIGVKLGERMISGRKYLQIYGTEAHRQVFGTDFWVDALLPQPSNMPNTEFDWVYRAEDNQEALAERFPSVDVLFVTDVRFPNEARRILDLGGKVWHIDADGRLGPLPPDAHPSEHPLPRDLITAIVPNNGTLEQFEVSVSSTWGLQHGV